MRIYIGVDPRQPIAYNVLQWSIVRRASVPVAVIPLILPATPITRVGLTDFTFTRYLAPALSGYKGLSLFLDADMLVLDDITKLAGLAKGDHDVYVVKGKERFEWPSLMLFNNEKCTTLTADYINDEANQPNTFDWAESVGELPPQWNFCVGYDEPEDSPSIIHYTAGIPHFAETRNCDYSAEWWAEYEAMLGNCSWLELMGDSVHAKLVISGINERKKQWQSRPTLN